MLCTPHTNWPQSQAPRLRNVNTEVVQAGKAWYFFSHEQCQGVRNTSIVTQNSKESNGSRWLTSRISLVRERGRGGGGGGEGERGRGRGGGGEGERGRGVGNIPHMHQALNVQLLNRETDPTLWPSSRK